MRLESKKLLEDIRTAAVLRKRSVLAVLAAGASLFLVGCGESGSTRDQTQTSQAAAPKPAQAAHALERIAIIGASLSSGFLSGTNVAQVLDASEVCAHEPIASNTSLFFFMSPGRSAAAQLDAALAGTPTLVVGVDFVFWFGYGAVGADGNPLASEEARLELLQHGLKLCERVECPLVLGDFADMQPAVGGMLDPSQMPQPGTLVKLNQRLREWARTRRNVILLPLDQFVKDVRARKPIKIGAHEFSAEATARWMQDDKLHTTDEGLVAVAMLIVDGLQKRQLATPQDFAADPDKVLARVRQAIEAQKGEPPPAGAGRQGH